MKKWLLKLGLCLLVLQLSTIFVEAQSFKLGLGARISPYPGINIKYFHFEKQALEAILYYRPSNNWRRAGMVLLYEFHHRFDSQKILITNLDWLWGVGMHFGYNDHFINETSQHNFFLVGVDALIGLEYLVPKWPISVGMDIRPFFDFSAFRKIFPLEAGFNVRYVFRGY